MNICLYQNQNTNSPITSILDFISGFYILTHRVDCQIGYLLLLAHLRLFNMVKILEDINRFLHKLRVTKLLILFGDG